QDIEHLDLTKWLKKDAHTETFELAVDDELRSSRELTFVCNESTSYHGVFTTVLAVYPLQGQEHWIINLGTKGKS
ncbi:hypothetical protein V3C99_000855, partial [Haemonchus contortus]